MIDTRRLYASRSVLSFFLCFYDCVSFICNLFSNSERFAYGLRIGGDDMKRFMAQDGCGNCANYTGALPANVPNFACAKGETLFRIFYCDKFVKKGAEDESIK